ncbi:uncharacterized protein ASCRUDRAFT_76715 [Ascoidea rubescens DSM 1968]|uniref:Uncharacterized protein n=1 Tax=Ascoidea rubescens DSM 1968 TaxID=1344418 RepID=A0A1D2VFI2_9ASCO|nr:hypothetical protein ASCRUDRAFT_76715 [Ascoidea rubescens DSM 1968]ODV60227.1 hypothetical protein ASCRUDRAFT_76715 [Ascoidea rubescens DSM 1968]
MDKKVELKDIFSNNFLNLDTNLVNFYIRSQNASFFNYNNVNINGILNEGDSDHNDSCTDFDKTINRDLVEFNLVDNLSLFFDINYDYDHFMSLRMHLIDYNNLIAIKYNLFDNFLFIFDINHNEIYNENNNENNNSDSDINNLPIAIIKTNSKIISIKWHKNPFLKNLLLITTLSDLIIWCLNWPKPILIKPIFNINPVTINLDNKDKSKANNKKNYNYNYKIVGTNWIFDINNHLHLNLNYLKVAVYNNLNEFTIIKINLTTDLINSLKKNGNKLFEFYLDERKKGKYVFNANLDSKNEEVGDDFNMVSYINDVQQMEKLFDDKYQVEDTFQFKK